jgi:Flp pilus assembly protein TadD
MLSASRASRSLIGRSLLFTLWLASLTVLAQNMPSTGRTSVHGSVRDAVTHRIMQNVIVMVEAQESGYAGQAETDSSGKFDIQGLPATVYDVRIRFPGYEEASQRVDLTVAGNNFLSFELRPKPGSQPPAVAPEGPAAKLNARMFSVPEKARKEFATARELALDGKDPQRSIDHLNKAIKIYPQFADAYVMLGTIYIQQGKAPDAKSSLLRAIEIDPKLPEARLTMGVLQNMQKDYPGAELSLAEGLKLDDNSPQGHYELSKTYWAMGRWQEAEPHALKAATLQPSMAPVHVMLGNIDLRKHDTAGALKEFQHYLAMDPKGPMAESVQAMVQRIQDTH